MTFEFTARYVPKYKTISERFFNFLMYFFNYFKWFALITVSTTYYNNFKIRTLLGYNQVTNKTAEMLPALKKLATIKPHLRNAQPCTLDQVE